MGACTLTPGNYCARLMNSIIGLGVSMSLAPFVCWERDGIALGWNGEGGGRKRDGGRGKEGKGGRKGEREQEEEEEEKGKKKRGCMEREGKGGNRGKEVRRKIKE